MKKELKPLFEKGDEVYAAWWSEGKRKIGGSVITPLWYPGRIKSYKVDTNHDSEYGPARLYDVK